MSQKLCIHQMYCSVGVARGIKALITIKGLSGDLALRSGGRELTPSGPLSSECILWCAHTHVQTNKYFFKKNLKWIEVIF